MPSDPRPRNGTTLTLRATGYNYPRVAALFDSRVEIDGCRTTFEQSRIGDMSTNTGRLGWASDMLPSHGKELEDTLALMGDHFYSYGFYSCGIRDNRSTLEALFRYSFEQDLSSREFTVEELFEPSLLDLSEDH